jgi:hypothetical protein
MSSEDEIKYDRSLLGVEHPIGTFHVTRELMLSFARATGETNPLFADEHGDIIAPPTFCNLFISGVARPDIKLEFGDTSFFASQAIECLAPIRPGDTLEARTKLKEVYAKTGRSGKIVFAVWETSFTNQRGEVVTLAQESFVRRNSGR